MVIRRFQSSSSSTDKRWDMGAERESGTRLPSLPRKLCSAKTSRPDSDVKKDAISSAAWAMVSFR